MKLDAETAGWVRHYSQNFTVPAMHNNLHELETRIRWFHPDHEWEREFRIAALRYLLSKPGQQLTLL